MLIHLQKFNFLNPKLQLKLEVGDQNAHPISCRNTYYNCTPSTIISLKPPQLQTYTISLYN